MDMNEVDLNTIHRNRDWTELGQFRDIWRLFVMTMTKLQAYQVLQFV